MAVSKPMRGDTNWDVTLNAKLDDLDLTLPTSANAVAATAFVSQVAAPTGVGATDTAVLNAAITAANASTTRSTLVLRGTYTVTGPLTPIDFTRVSILGMNAVLDCSGWGANTGALITVPNSGVAAVADTPNFAAWSKSFAGVAIKGPGRSVTGNTCISLAGYDVNSHAARGILFRECAFTGWQTIFVNGANAFLNSFNHCAFDAFSTAVSLPNVSNSGERTHFQDCIFSGNTGSPCLVLSLANPFADALFYGCSLDYCNQLANVSAGRADFIGCHLEFGNWNASSSFGAGIAPSALIVNGPDNSADIRVLGGTLILPGTGLLPTYVVDNQSTYGVVAFRGVTLSSPFGSSNLFNSTGAGVVQISDFRQNNGGSFPTPFMQGTNNTAIDGTNEQATVIDPWWITADSGAISGRLTSANTNVTVSSTTAQAGTKSLRIAIGPTSAPGTGEASLFVPAKGGQAVFASLYYAKPGTETGTVYITGQWVSAALSPTSATVLRSQDINFVPVTLTSSALPFTKFTVTSLAAPPWATHFAFRVNAGNMTTGNFYIDSTSISIL